MQIIHLGQPKIQTHFKLQSFQMQTIGKNSQSHI